MSHGVQKVEGVDFMAEQTFLKFARTLFLAILLTLTHVQASANGIYENPLDFFRRNQPQSFEFALEKSGEIYRKLKLQGYEYPLEAAATVFPELLRYSIFQDEIETLFNEIIANVSEESDGFSIGLMQMKPIFASTVEKQVSVDPVLRKKYLSIALEGDRSTVEVRRARILRLRSFDSQLEYLKAFVDYEVTALNLAGESRENRIKYLSAAYNLGVSDRREPLERVFTLENFPSGKRRLFFNYQRICLSAVDGILQPFP